MSLKIIESLLLHILGRAEDSPKVESQSSCDEYELADEQKLCKELEGLTIEKQEEDYSSSPKEMQKNPEGGVDSDESPEESDTEDEESVSGLSEEDEDDQDVPDMWRDEEGTRPKIQTSGDDDAGAADP